MGGITVRTQQTHISARAGPGSGDRTSIVIGADPTPPHLSLQVLGAQQKETPSPALFYAVWLRASARLSVDSVSPSGKETSGLALEGSGHHRGGMQAFRVGRTPHPSVPIGTENSHAQKLRVERGHS